MDTDRALLPYGFNNYQIGARIRLIRYGKNGGNYPHEWCRSKKHRMIPCNVIVYKDGRRRCIACYTLWKEKQKRLRALRRVVVATHPDHGGSKLKFHKVWQKYVQVREGLQ